MKTFKATVAQDSSFSKVVDAVNACVTVVVSDESARTIVFEGDEDDVLTVRNIYGIAKVEEDTLVANR